MSEMNFDDVINQLPSEIEGEESRKFTAEPGLYKAIWANTIPVYKDTITGKYVEEPTPQCELAFVSQRFILMSYIGTTSVEPTLFIRANENNELVIVNESKVDELIYRDSIPLDKSSQWKIHNKYENSFNPPLWEERGNKKVTLLSNFPKQYGKVVYLFFDISKRGSVYLKTVKPTGVEYPPNEIDELLKTIASLLELKYNKTQANEVENNVEEDLPF